MKLLVAEFRLAVWLCQQEVVVSLFQFDLSALVYNLLGSVPHQLPLAAQLPRQEE